MLVARQITGARTVAGGFQPRQKRALVRLSSAMSADQPDPPGTVCPCNNCSGHLEFDPSRAGETIQCPLCGMETVLFIPQVPVGASPHKRVLTGPPAAAAASTSSPPASHQKVPESDVAFALSILGPVELEESGVALALFILGAIELAAAVIAGPLVGLTQSVSLGWLIFASGVTSGLILLGFAKVIDHLYESAQRLRRIESLLQEAKDNKK